MDALKMISQDSLKTEIPQFSVGDTVRVSVNIREGERERIQQFEGTVIAKKGSGISEKMCIRDRLRKVFGIKKQQAEQ